ncbi:aldo/keto reductase [Mesorhizobium sp. M0923]|uniref:aldo/keto reductase n=1 Tax=unclassified Mesorhizobium TaxID=325217 RepID=UPI0003CF2448|nr:aldo/keto reductase [Mesorhizobium sp. LSHC420B00]ESX82330.1 NADP-dependent oxidoreductase [Mesorhizobium sp. LSHC420B00]
MKRTILGPEGPHVSSICLGSMTWGRQNTEAEAHAQLDRAVERGVNFIDTAEVYPVNPVREDSVGRTESYIGSWLAPKSRRDDLVIATKVSGLGQDVVRGGAKINAETLRTAVENSLRRLRTDYIDLYQLHVPNRSHYHFRRVWSFDPSGQVKAETVAGMAECLETLAALRNEGKIRHFGLSNETTWGIAQWLRLADDDVGPRPLTIQNEYSLLCRYYDTDLAELAVNEGVTLLAYSPAGAGLLSGKYRPDYSPEGSRRALNGDLGGRCTPRVWPAVDAYISIAREAGIHPVTMAVAFVRSRPFPVVPIVGATSVEQLDHALDAASVALSPDILARIGEAYRAHPMPF